MIPHKLFVLLVRALAATDALDELQIAHGVALGAALAIDGKDSKTQRAAKKLARRAFPEVSM